MRLSHHPLLLVDTPFQFVSEFIYRDRRDRGMSLAATHATMLVHAALLKTFVIFLTVNLGSLFYIQLDDISVSVSHVLLYYKPM
jgi:hypothetical protein